MSRPLFVDPGAALHAGAVAREQSEAVTAYLRSVDQDVEDLVATWKGDAAMAYSDAWRELLPLLQSMAAELDRLGEHVSRSTAAFVESDLVE
ncbi:MULTISPECIES: WXG100 family type VII secretion target [unclassified Mycobacterium]|uniref:WXG100 family type VII secretion target n=1 Tax=unclassified Mycobacterium TaxID=2642494 RepID=UPI000FB56237|nr:MULTISPECIES: WXG100 family type VII secretion target [unclassified Mycobacterium]MDP7702699.1 WXG100 family type VII secretion target [Mycobacterium sp. TY815]MDP7721191.1 WXG100 family type VII secretion target [Mycobacterium sp. TY814]RUP02157.1 MAG: WXG100 family type VII secretion target [Mycobacterium sp.]